MVDLLGDVGAMIADARPERLNRLYRELGLELRYKPGEQPVYVTAQPRVASAVSEGGLETQNTVVLLGTVPSGGKCSELGRWTGKPLARPVTSERVLTSSLAMRLQD